MDAGQRRPAYRQNGGRAACFAVCSKPGIWNPLSFSFVAIRVHSCSFVANLSFLFAAWGEAAVN